MTTWKTVTGLQSSFSLWWFFGVIICVMHFRVLEGAVNEGITLILILSTQLCLNKLPASIPPTPLFQLLWNKIGVTCVCEHVCGVGGEKEVFCVRPGMYVFSAPAACAIRCCWMGHFPQNPCWQKWVHFWILRWSKYYVIHFVSNLFVVVVCFLADDLILEINCIFFQ